MPILPDQGAAGEGNSSNLIGTCYVNIEDLSLSSTVDGTYDLLATSPSTMAQKYPPYVSVSVYLVRLAHPLTAMKETITLPYGVRVIENEIT